MMQRLRTGSCRVLLLFAALITCDFAFSTATEPPKLLGNLSCSTATCHGGIVGQGPAWHSSVSVWESHDPHGDAGTVLLTELSRKIVLALSPETAAAPEGFDAVLKQSCVGCHAPSASMSLASTDAGVLRKQLVEGVSCEACHGAASNWRDAHIRREWDASDRFSASSGMLDTESLLMRSQNCARCHVGSRSADGLVRDMNHDMIAAGHPPLYFDMWHYQKRMPVHWDERREKLATTRPEFSSQVYDALRAQVLLAAVRLSRERQQAQLVEVNLANTAVFPELSEFDCAACHHHLSTTSPRLVRRSKGQALWHPWYTAAQLPVDTRHQLRLNEPRLLESLNSLEQKLASTAESDLSTASNTGQVNPVKSLQDLLSATEISRQLDNRYDYSSLSTWMDRLQIAGQTAPNLPEAQREKFQSVLTTNRQRLQPARARWPAQDRLLPQPWLVTDGETVRAQLLQSIARPDNGASQ